MKHHTRRLSVLLIAISLAMSFALSSCMEAITDKFKGNKKSQIDISMLKPDEMEEIKIGVFQPLSGKEAEGGVLTEEGILLAHEMRPFILGKKVVLVTGDSQSTIEGATKAAQDLVDKGVKAVIGSYGSSFSIAGGKVFRAAGIPAVGCSPTNPAVTRGNPYYFRVCFIDPFQGTVGANFCKSQLNVKNAVIIRTPGDTYSEGLCDTFEKSFPNEQEGTSIVAQLSMSPDQTNFDELISQIQNYNPDVIYAPGSFLLCGKMVNALRKAQIKAPIIGGDTWETSDFINAAGSKYAGDRVYFTSHFSSYSDINEISIRFVSDFRNKYKREPSAFAALGYDAYMLLMEAIDRSEHEDPKAIRDNLANTKLYVGVTGIITLNEEGDAVKDAVVLTVINGRFSFLQKVSPANDKSAASSNTPKPDAEDSGAGSDSGSDSGSGESNADSGNGQNDDDVSVDESDDNDTGVEVNEN